MIYPVFSAIIETFVIYIIGAYCFKRGMLQKESINGLTKIALDVMMPMLTFATITKNFDRSNLNEFWVMPLLGFCQILFGALIGLLAVKFMRNGTIDRKKAFMHVSAINNYLYLPLIVLQNLYPEGRHVALLLIMNVGSTLGLWTIGVVTLTGGGFKDNLRNVLSFNLYAVLLALPLAFFGVRIPTMLEHCMAQIGGMCVPFSLLLIGAALYNIGGKVLHNLGDAFWYTLVRLVILPFLLVVLLRLLPLTKECYETLIIVALMPASCNAILMTHRYGGSSEFAGQAILLTTIFSTITMPLWVYLLHL